MDATIQSHNQKPAAVWSSGGSAYDAISRGIADSIEHCVLRLGPRQGERILDLATGTGWTSRAVARRGAKVVGADIASDLVAAAKARAAAEGLDIEYRIGDAEKLPFADGEFDAVISTCGVMFASRPEAAASELGRVCRKGGRIALTHLAFGQQPVQDVPGHETVYGASAEPRAAVAVRVGTDRADKGAAGPRLRSQVRERRVVLSRTEW